MLLEPGLLSRLERLAFVTRSRLEAPYPGEHRSRRQGTSVNFVDWRPYVPGDDFRRIDYQIYARLDRLLIRLYEAEDELTTRIVIDSSASMSFAGKHRRALEIAAGLAYVSATRRNRVRIWIAGESGLRPSPWATTRDGALELFRWLEEVSAEGGCDLAAALRTLRSGGRSSGMTILISDLLTESWEGALKWLGGPSDEATLIQILSSGERDPQERGDLTLVDSESRATLPISVSEQVLRAYRKRTASWLMAVAESARRRGVRYLLADPAAELEDVLLRELRGDGLLR